MNTSKIFLIIIVIVLGNFFFMPMLLAKDYDLAAEELFAFGKALFQQQDYIEAKHELEKCLILNPRHNQAKNFLELCETKIAPEKKRAKAMLAALEKTKKNIKPKTETPVITPKEEVASSVESKEVTAGKELLAPPLQKGAWTLKKGQAYAETYTKYYWHNHQFTNGRKKKRWGFDGKYNEIMTELKLEYGLSDTDTLLLYTAAKEAQWKDSFRSSTRKGFTEIKPGIKHLLFTEPFICTLQAKIKFPLNYDEEATPALSTHQIDGEIKILTAQPWPKLPGYTKFESGFRLRAEERSNEIPYFSELGYNLTPNLILKTTLDGQVGVGGGIAEDWTKYTIGPIFKIRDLFNIEFGYGHTFAGRNSSAAKEVFSTISCQW